MCYVSTSVDVKFRFINCIYYLKVILVHISTHRKRSNLTSLKVSFETFLMSFPERFLGENKRILVSTIIERQSGHLSVWESGRGSLQFTIFRVSVVIVF